jgi:uncharacterized protein
LIWFAHRLRGPAALGAILALAACDLERPAVEAAAAPAAVQKLAAPGPGPDAPVPAGFEALEVVTQKGRTRFFVEIADTDAKRQQGLMRRAALAPDRGMLFDFHRPQPVAFWMKDTWIPLDIIFIQADGTVLTIARNTTPYSEAPIPSGGPIRGVLEIAGGRAAEIGLLPGDKVEHRIFAGG